MKKKVLFIMLALSTNCRENIEELGECSILMSAPLSYSIHIYPIISKACAIPQCHTSNFEYGNFNLFEELKRKADDGELEFMIETHQMPHGFTEGPSHLSRCEIETIKKWIHEGANNN